MTDTPAAGDEPTPEPDGLGALLREGVLKLLRAPRLGRRGVRLLVAIVVIGWAATSIYRVQPDEQGVVLRFGRWIDTTQPGLHVHLPFPIDSVLFPKVTQINQVQLGNPGAPGDPASGRERQMLTGDENIVEADCAVFWKIRDAGEFLFRVNAPEAAVKIAAEGALARRDQPHADPGGDVRQAPADRRPDQGGAAVAARRRARRHRDHPGPVAAGRAAAGGDRRLQRRAARARRSGALAQRGGSLRQRHPAARARRRRAPPPGRGGLQDPGRQPRPGRRQRLPRRLRQLPRRQGRHRLAPLSRQRRRDAAQGDQGHPRHFGQGRLERRALHAGDRDARAAVCPARLRAARRPAERRAAPPAPQPTPTPAQGAVR